MAAELLNLTTTERLKRGAVLRVTIAQYSRILANSEFGRKLGTFWEQLAGTRLMFPISPNPALKDSPIGVVDVRVTADNTVAADVLRALDGLAGFYLRVTRVAQLDAVSAAVAAGNAGAAERDEAKAQQAKKEEWGNIFPFDKLAGAIGTTVSIVKWALVAVVVVGLVLLIVNGRRILAAVKS